jgi:hypothetical protein
LNESVVEIDRRLREQRRPWTTWPLPFYVSRYHQRAPRSMAGNTEVENVDEPDVPVARMATVETPVFLPLEQRARMHLAAIEAALRWLHHQ